MKKIYIIFLLIVGIFLTGCGASDEQHTQTAKVDDIKTIYIEHGSDNLILESADHPYIEASYNKQGVTLDKSDETITLGINNSKINIGPKLNLSGGFKVIIPNYFKGDVVINGSSGSVSSDQLSTYNLDIKTNSGDISIAFAEFHSNVQVVTTSGEVELVLNEEQPDVELKSRTKSGSNTIIIPISLSEFEEGKKIEGISGEGSNQIDIKTKSGDIIVRNN